MRWLDKLERRFGRHAVPNVTMGFILGQVALYLLVQFGRADVINNAVLVPNLVLKGEVWRLVTFLFVPPLANPLFAFFFWYLFYLMGTALEHHWGAFRYNAFLLVGTIATMSAAFLTPNMPTHGFFLQGSVFLAFAFLYPNFVLHLFFFLPVKIKWLALIQWIYYFLTIVFGDWTSRLVATAAVFNFLLFFQHDIFLRIKQGRRRMAMQAKTVADKHRPRHVCTACGVTSLSDPKMRFRYCSLCEGQCGYCMDHIRDHEHVVKESRV